MNRLSLLLVFFIFISCKVLISQEKDIKKDLQNIIDKKCNKYYQEHGIEKGGLLIYISSPQGKILLKNRMPEGTNENYHFRIGNITNTFTAAGIMIFQDQGQLNYKSKITSSFPGRAETYIADNIAFNIPFKSDITIEMLLNHRSGIFDVNNEIIPGTANQPYKGYNYVDYIKNIAKQKNHQFSFDELINIAASNKLYHSLPNQKFHYSGTDYSILGKIIERITKSNYSDMIENFFVKYDELTNTYSVWKADEYAPKVPYIPAFMKIKDKTEEVTFDNVTANIAEADIISTPSDLIKWIKLLIDGNAGVSPKSVNLMKTFRPTEDGVNYGLGLYDYDDLGVGHWGVRQGYVSQLTYNPDDDIAILIMNNFEDTPNIQTQLDFLNQIAKECYNIAKKTIPINNNNEIDDPPAFKHGEDE